MEATALVATLTQILEHPGSLLEKIILGVILLSGVHMIGKNHVKSLTQRLDNISNELHSISELHRKHENRIEVLETKIEMILSNLKVNP